jgi:hypothetical protein
MVELEERCDGSGVALREAPQAVRRKALGAGAGAWLESLPALVAALERDGSISVGRPYTGGTDAFVAEATRGDGVPAVLKLRIPRADGSARHELTALRLADGDGCARLLDHDLGCARRRVAAHDDARAVLVHGDLHPWNALQAAAGFKLVDPDGLLAEPEYALGILMREDPAEFCGGGARERALALAVRTGLDATAIDESGAVERVSTGLLCVEVGLEPAGSEMLAVAEQVARER